MSSATAAHSASASASQSGKGLLIGSWIARVAVAGIFIMAAVGKLSGNAAPLVDAMADYGGGPAVMAIGIIELIAAVLILVPKTALIGAGAAILVMLGALGSHVAILGFSGDVGSMWPMAVGALVAAVAAAVTLLKLKR
ncbi:MAG: DoxX family membrane protein [Phycisphaerales bacterium]